uniref:Uncharacterized protein n=1 Tax=Salix viminalis TaxID=40686 RepID=A0A6N2N190_SALVM
MVGVGSPLLMEIKSIHVSCRSYSPSKRVLTFAVSTPQSTSQLSLHNSLPLRQNGFASSDTLDFDQRWVQFFSVSRPNFYRLLSLLSPSLVIFPSQSLQKPLLHPPFTASPTARVIKLWRVNLVWIPLRRPALRFIHFAVIWRELWLALVKLLKSSTK